MIRDYVNTSLYDYVDTAVISKKRKPNINIVSDPSTLSCLYSHRSYVIDEHVLYLLIGCHGTRSIGNIDGKPKNDPSTDIQTHHCVQQTVILFNYRDLIFEVHSSCIYHQSYIKYIHINKMCSYNYYDILTV